jgi:hypothetical protein
MRLAICRRTHLVGTGHAVEQVGAPDLPEVLKVGVVDVDVGDIVHGQHLSLLLEPVEALACVQQDTELQVLQAPWPVGGTGHCCCHS